MSKKNYFDTEKKLKDAIEAVKGSKKREYLYVAPALTLQIGIRGKKVWIFKPTNTEGWPFSFNFGTYPEVSLKEVLNESQIALASLAVNYKAINQEKLERADIRNLDYLPKPITPSLENTFEEVLKMANAQGFTLTTTTTYQLFKPGSEDRGIWTANSLNEIIKHLEFLKPRAPQFKESNAVYFISRSGSIDCDCIHSVVSRDGQYFYEVGNTNKGHLFSEKDLFRSREEAVTAHIRLLKEQLSLYEPSTGA